MPWRPGGSRSSQVWSARCGGILSSGMSQEDHLSREAMDGVAVAATTAPSNAMAARGKPAACRAADDNGKPDPATQKDPGAVTSRSR